MIVDGLTKVLSGQKFRDFIGMISLVDIRDRLQTKKRLEALREQAITTRPNTDSESERKGEGRVAS